MLNWKDVHDYEGLYQVSDCGQVKSLARLVTNKNGTLQRYPEKLLTPDWLHRNHTSYARVTLCKGHKTQRYGVHRLVAKAFLVPGLPEQILINHLDNDGTNNNHTNLEWCTHAENMQHAQDQGRLFATQSLAGIANGVVQKARLDAEFAEMVGSQFSYWTVKAYAHYKGKKHYLLCECVCGKNQTLEAGRLRRMEVTSCKSCAFKKRSS